MKAKLKPLKFLGSSLKDLRNLPVNVRADLGYQLHLVQTGEGAADVKPMGNLGNGVEEIRVRDAKGIYRAVYVAKFVEAVYVLHVFQKKDEAIARKDMEAIRERYRDLTVIHQAVTSAKGIQ